MDWFSSPAILRLERQQEAAAFDAKCAALWRGLKEMLMATVTLYENRFPAEKFQWKVAYDAASPNAPYVRRFLPRVQAIPEIPAAPEIAAGPNQVFEPAVPARPAVPPQRELEEGRVTISFASPNITATYDTSKGQAQETLSMNRDADGYVVLSYKGKPISFDRAGVSILGRRLSYDRPIT